MFADTTSPISSSVMSLEAPPHPHSNADHCEPQLEHQLDEACLPARILIVDDDRDQAEALAYCLRQQGFDTLWACNGEEGLELARRITPDLIVLDIRMPGLSGLDVCSQLSDDPTTCCIPVIIVSAMERPGILRAARAAGCRYYLRKPYDPNALLILLNEALKQ